MNRRHSNSMILLVSGSEGSKIHQKADLHHYDLPTRSSKTSKHRKSEKKRISNAESSLHKSRRRKDKKSVSSLQRRNDSDRSKVSKEVRFHGNICRRFVPYIPEEDHGNVWYSMEEFKETRKRENALQQCISSNKMIFNSIRENLNAEGVMTDEQQEKVNRIVDASLDAVLQEQDKQERAYYVAVDKSQKFSLDCQKISNVYRSHSEQALKEAQQRAARHEQHLEAIGIKFLSYSSPFSPSTCTKKGILRRHSTNSQKALTQSSKREISRPPVHLPATS